MKILVITFLKVFFRNRRAMFFVLLLPSTLFVIAAYLGLGQVVRFDTDGIRYSDFLIAGIIAFSLMQTGIYTSAYTLVDYRRLKILKRLFITPLTPAKFLIAQILSRFTISLVQSAILLFLGLLLFKTKLGLEILLLPILIFVGSTLFLQFGFLISSIARDYEEAAPYTSVTGLTLTFLGDVFFPVSNLSPTLVTLAKYLPLQPLSELMRYSILGLSPESALGAVAILLIWLFGLTVLSNYLFKKCVFQ